MGHRNWNTILGSSTRENFTYKSDLENFIFYKFSKIFDVDPTDLEYESDVVCINYYCPVIGMKLSSLIIYLYFNGIDWVIGVVSDKRIIFKNSDIVRLFKPSIVEMSEFSKNHFKSRHGDFSPYRNSYKKFTLSVKNLTDIEEIFKIIANQQDLQHHH